MFPTLLLLSSLAISLARADDTSTVISFTQTFPTASVVTTTLTGSDFIYLSNTGQVTLSPSSSRPSNNSANSTSTSSNSQITYSTTSVSLTEIGGITATSATGSGNATSSIASSTSSSVQPTNTTPCNGYPEFCNRAYSNITEVCAHNSAFVVKNNAGSNQMLPIIDQLNDGVRMLQGETQFVNNTLYNCHTSCDLLNAGTWQSELEIVAGWLRDNPYDVLTILIGNSDFIDVQNYVAPITNAGLLQYVYYPEYVPQHRNQWPTLGEMILRNQRLVLFMDYNANQTSVPYILDEFSHMWETPFSPTDPNFPCTVQRPPDLDDDDARENYMYIANHNLNTAIDISSILGTGSDGSSSILIPNTAQLNRTNGQANEYGQLGAMSINCTQKWNRPPNFLLVDYYNIGSPEDGSVFHVAAAANGVTYTRKCCGSVSAAPTIRASLGALVAALFSAVLLLS